VTAVMNVTYKRQEINSFHFIRSLKALFYSEELLQDSGIGAMLVTENLKNAIINIQFGNNYFSIVSRTVNYKKDSVIVREESNQSHKASEK
jgi:hypothetical protein